MKYLSVLESSVVNVCNVKREVAPDPAVAIELVEVIVIPVPASEMLESVRADDVLHFAILFAVPEPETLPTSKSKFVPPVFLKYKFVPLYQRSPTFGEDGSVPVAVNPNVA